ncbi:hypothetical protein TNCT_461212 [Trichonephila clavata]|uniref:Uncharacterized protein n=1 Tax=Trichonephila clavata TaxID=2740835 RepID=A0A8X6JMN9_TRICU|nr:hypothetical protein TNCT_461212 [Trichonephila clavata]
MTTKLIYCSTSISPKQKFERSPTRQRSMAFDRSHISPDKDISPRRHSSPRRERRRSPTASYRATDSERTYGRRDNNAVYGAMDYTGRLEDTSCGIKNCKIERAMKELQESDEERCPDRKHFVSEKCRSLIHPPQRGSAWRSPSPRSQGQPPMVRKEQKRRDHSPEYHGVYDYSYESGRPYSDKDEDRCPDRKHLVTEKCRSHIHPPKRGSTRRSTSPERRGHSPAYHTSYDYSYTAGSSKPFTDKVKQRFEKNYGAADSDRTFSQELKRKPDKSCGIKNCEREMALKEMQESDEERCPDRKHLVTEKCLSIIHPPKRGSYRWSTAQRRNEPKRRDQFSIYRADYDPSNKTGIPYSDKETQRQKLPTHVDDKTPNTQKRVHRTSAEEEYKDVRHQNVPTDVKEVVHDLKEKVHRTTSGERFKDVKRPNIPTDDKEERINELRKRAQRNSEERHMEMKMREDIVYNIREEIDFRRHEHHPQDHGETTEEGYERYTNENGSEIWVKTDQKHSKIHHKTGTRTSKK